MPINLTSHLLGLLKFAAKMLNWCTRLVYLGGDWNLEEGRNLECQSVKSAHVKI